VPIQALTRRSSTTDFGLSPFAIESSVWDAAYSKSTRVVIVPGVAIVTGHW